MKLLKILKPIKSNGTLILSDNNHLKFKQRKETNDKDLVDNIVFILANNQI